MLGDMHNYEKEIPEIDNSGMTAWKDPVYKKWRSMMHRCYYPSQIRKGLTYAEVVVCEDWLKFMNFQKWYKHQIEDECLDKDLKVFGNTVYSPDTCLLVSHEVNNFLVGIGGEKVTYSRGVAHYTNRGKKCWKSQINMGEGSQFLSWSYSQQEAHATWQKAKALRSLQLSEKQVCPTIRERLEVIAINLLEDVYNSKETINLKGMNYV